MKRKHGSQLQFSRNMRNFSHLAGLALVLTVASCSPKARISMTVDGISNEKLAIHKIGTASSELLDSVKTDAAGHFNYSITIEKGKPEFVYVFRGETRLAALLLSPSEKAKVQADTLGNYSVEGSVGSEELCSVESDFANFIHKMNMSEDNLQASKLYIQYYRDRVQYVLSHPYSLTVVPVLYQRLGPEAPIFSQSTDAILFRRAADSLASAYPNSSYVKSLEAEATRRENQMSLDMALRNATVSGFPDIILPNTSGEKISLAGVNAKVILVHFWDAADAEQTLFNEEALMPLYKEFHSKGMEIYSVCLSTDKAQWASVVRNQGLPWINVCDARGAASTLIGLYNLKSLPSTILITDGEISTGAGAGSTTDLRSIVSKALKK